MKEPRKKILCIIRDLAANDDSDRTAGMEVFEKVAKYSRKYGEKKKAVATSGDE